MSTLRGLRSLFRNLLRRDRTERDLDAEVRAHLDLLIQEKLREGLPPDEARRAARIELGGVEQLKEEVRAVRAGAWLEQLWKDLRYGARQLLRHPGLTFVTVLTLATGIGANTAMFSMVNGVLLRPLPVPSPERIVVLAIAEKGSALGAQGFSYPEFTEFRAEAGSFCDILGAALAGPEVGFTAGDRTESISLTAVSNNYFSGLGVNPAVGRLLQPGEGETPGEQGVLVLGYSYWLRRFGGDPDIVGRKARIAGIPVSIIGVTPKDFYGSHSIFDIEGYVSLSTIAQDEHWKKIWTDRGMRMILAMARLKADVSRTQAQARLDVISARLAKQYPATDGRVTVRVIPERLARPIPYANNPVLVLSGLFLALTGLILLLACGNVANILIARASVRRAEMAIRTALGAGRGRLIRQLLAETMLLAILGGCLGVLLAVWLNRMLGTVHFPSFPVRLDYGLDWRVFAFALAAACGSGIAAGISPAIRATHANIHVVLHGGSGGDSSVRDAHRVRGDLMAAQVAGSLMLLIVAGLFVRSLQSAQETYLGIDPGPVLNLTLDPQTSNYDRTQTTEFYRALEARLSALPGVESVSQAAFVPIESPPDRRPVYVPDRPLPPGQRPPTALYNRVDAGYFKTLRVPILRGRGISAADDENAPAVAIINQTMADQFWPHEDPIGKRFQVKESSAPIIEVVGVMQDGKYLSIGEDPQPYFCVPLLQDFVSRRVLQIRSSRPLAPLGDEVRSELTRVALGVPVLGLRTMHDAIAGAKGLFMYRLGASLAAAMGALGLLLAVIGVYGMVSYATAQRTHEIGIRRALGASSADIGKLVLGRGMQVIIGGVLAGLVGAWLLSRVMAGYLLGVSSNDSLTYCGSTLLICAVTLLASWIPARRALRVDPMIALRHE